MMKTLFIYNPNAGLKQIKNHIYDILNVFSKANYDLTVFPTKTTGEAISYTRKHASKYDLVIVSGGDGTLNEVVNGLLTAKTEKIPKLGYIPAGSTNDFANSIKLPKDMTKASELITIGQPKEYDVGKFGSRYFTYIAAFGLFTEVSYATPQQTKNIIGHFAYLLEGLKSLSKIKSYKVRVKAADIKIEGNFIYGMVTNTYSVGGVYKIDKKYASLNDGKFEVTLIREPKDPIQLAEINSYIINHSSKTDMVVTFKTDKITFESDKELEWTLDGEYGGSTKKVNINVLPSAINIISK